MICVTKIIIKSRLTLPKPRTKTDGIKSPENSKDSLCSRLQIHWPYSMDREGERSATTRTWKMDSEKISLFVLQMETFSRHSLVRRAIFPPREERPYFFSTLVSWTGFWPLVSRRFQPSSGVTHFRRVYQALAKASCLFSDSDSFRNKSARADRVFRESKGHQIELRGFTPRPWGQ